LRIVEAVLFRTRYTVACADEAFPAVIAVWSMLTVDVPDAVTTDAGEVPITALTYVPERLMSLPSEVDVTTIGAVPVSVVTETLFCSVRNSFMSIHTRVGSTGAMSESNSS
jgi:hypothetical protein